MISVVHLPVLLLGVAGMAAVFAKVEIHIEGKDGWAGSLPTWRIEKHWLLDVFFGGRPLTGYHAWALPFSLLIFHFPLLFAWDWSWRLEARCLACLMVFWIIEDLLWFILNPAWGWRRFTPTEVRWHKHWLFGLPTDYWTFAIIAAGLLWFAYR